MSLDFKDGSPNWQLLRLALTLAHHDHKTDAEIKADAKLNLDTTRLSVFRNRDGRLGSPADAKKLYAYLDDKGYIADARKTLDPTPIPALADGLTEFYDTNPGQIADLKAMHICGDYWGYKFAFRKPGWLIRTIWRISEGSTDKFLAVEELQRSSGAHEADGRHLEEKAEGIAISKSQRLWGFLREASKMQPRIICLARWKPAPVKTDKGPGERIVALSGHILEHDLKYHHGLFNTPTLLLRAEETHTDLAAYETGLDFIRPKKPSDAVKLGVDAKLYTAICDHLHGTKTFF